MENKIFDCITFFDNNLMFELRYHILSEVVDCFVICESKYDHKNTKKKLNFKNLNFFDQRKIKYIVIEEPFPERNNVWENQAHQREYLLNNLNFLNKDDYIFFLIQMKYPIQKYFKIFS